MNPARRRGAAVPATVASLLLLGSCGNDTTPNALRPAGHEASTLATVTWLIAGAAAAVAVVVAATILWAALRPPRDHPGSEDAFVAIGGAAIPAVVLIATAVLTVMATMSTRGADARQDALHIEVVGRRWFWDVTYTDTGVVTANELTIPVDRPVELTLESGDVIHSFWVPELAGKQDMIPGTTNRLEIEASETGTFWGVCAEFCGAQHAGMGLAVIVLDGPEFDAWLADRADVVAPTGALETEGRRVFEAAPCGGCHRIAGTDAQGDRGPDLTHLSTRLTIGAGVLDNTSENVARWITSVQDVKPGAEMRGFDFDDADLDALVAYLEADR